MITRGLNGFGGMVAKGVNVVWAVAFGAACGVYRISFSDTITLRHEFKESIDCD